jgi:hypothetical protein
VHLLGREEIFRQEPTEPAVVDLADERPHGATVTRPAVRRQAGSTHSPAPAPSPEAGRSPSRPKGVGSRPRRPPFPDRHDS